MVERLIVDNSEKFAVDHRQAAPLHARKYLNLISCAKIYTTWIVNKQNIYVRLLQLLRYMSYVSHINYVSYISCITSLTSK